MQKLQRYLVGAALVAALPTLIPIYQKTMKPLANEGKKLIDTWLKEAKVLALKAKYEIEDIWLEAYYDQIQKQYQQKNGGTNEQFIS